MAEHLDTVRATELANVVKGAIASLPEDPRERAEMRLARLQASFAASLALVGEMYRDRDWEHLTREDGTTYASLSEVLSDVMEVSASMARRYVQGARDLWLPLSEITVDGTRIAITAGDVAVLGTDGLHDAVSIATENLDGIDDADESSEIISSAIADAKERKQASKPAPASREDDWADDSAPARGMSFTPGADGGDMFDDLPDDDEEDYDSGDPIYSTESTATTPAPAAKPSLALDDPVQSVMEQAVIYTEPEDFDSLPEGVREVAQAIHVLAAMDARAIAAAIEYPTRGVIAPVTDATKALSSLRALVTTQPWFIAKMS